MTRLLLAVALVVAFGTAAGAGAPATYGARTTADEPQYLLSALSLGEDLDLDISDELAEHRWRAFHRAELPEQTRPLDDGRRVSPHDPLLPAVLAVPMAAGGWLAAKLTLAGLAAALAAALVWVATRRFAVPVGVTALVVVGFGLSAPLAPYATQVYPELPAALAVTLAVAALTGPLDGRGRLLLGASVAALPWLAVKHAPVAAVLAALGLVTLWRRADRRPALVLAVALAGAAVAFLGFHRLVYGGWTAYAAGDHFVGGEATVMGVDPDYAGRSRRLLGLLVDRGFGLSAWAPAFLLAVPALAALARRRPRGTVALVLPLAAGWLTATFVAFTMHGWWWPGRQVVAVVPLLVLAVAWWAGQVRAMSLWVVVLSVAGVATWAWTLAEAWAGRLTLVVDFEGTTNPLYRAWRLALPDYRQPSTATWALHGLWLLAVAALAVAGWRSCRPSPADPADPSTSSTDRSTQPALA